jgi:hypothetical protein
MIKAATGNEKEEISFSERVVNSIHLEYNCGFHVIILSQRDFFFMRKHRLTSSPAADATRPLRLPN